MIRADGGPVRHHPCVRQCPARPARSSPFHRPLCAALCGALLIALGSRTAPAGVLGPWPRPPAPSTPPHPAVVRVLAEEVDGIAQGSGTLVGVQGPYGLIVTNWHVVRDASGAVTVVFPDGFRSAARVLKVDRDWDLAALLIWRPSVTAVPLAQQAPRPGDPLTIAGYGSGTYRTASGRCTQYVAPSDHHPFEIVEVATTARQGDSGGPIFNQRGELAGVLFGSDGGATAGSYSGRIRHFLASAWPPAEPPDQSAVARTGAGEPRPPVHRLPDVEPPAEQVSQLTPLPPLGRTATPGPSDPDLSPPSLAPPEEPVPTPAATVQWSDLAGTTLYEQVKTVLAVIGLAAVFLRLTRAGQPGD